MPFPQMAPHEDDRAAELYALGFSQPEVAGIMNRSRKAVRQALKRKGIQPRTSPDGYREWIRRAGHGNRRKRINSVFALGATSFRVPSADGQ